MCFRLDFCDALPSRQREDMYAFDYGKLKRVDNQCDNNTIICIKRLLR